MFNTILPFRRVQRNCNQTGGRESWRWADIYKFFMHSPTSRRKYLVEIHAYDNHLYTADFYAKVNNVNSPPPLSLCARRGSFLPSRPARALGRIFATCFIALRHGLYPAPCARKPPRAAAPTRSH